MITIVITKLRDTVTAALLEDGRVREFQPEPRETSLVGNIYTGRVKHILRNIEAAFVEFAPAKNGYLSLRDNGLADLREGSELAVQVEKDAVKTKEPVLTANLSFSGRYTVVTAVRRQRALSARITDKEERERLREILEKYEHPEFGIIARTEAAGVSEEMILAEAESLTSEARSVLEKSRTRTPETLLYSAEPSYIRIIRGNLRNMERITTDIPECRDRILEFLRREAPELEDRFVFYEDESYPLRSLYRLEKALEDALERRVWLKSGGYLVIEPTEALTVIDVNTGKYSDRKRMDETVLAINLEAAEASAGQMRLRNLSGIILIDFINMRREEDRETLMRTLRSELRKDPVKTVLVDITGLGLVEITRKKVQKPLYEIFREHGKTSAFSEKSC